MLGHSIDFHQESNCLDDVQPDDVICAKNRCQIQVDFFSSYKLGDDRCNRFVSGPTFCPTGPNGQFQVSAIENLVCKG